MTKKLLKRFKTIRVIICLIRIDRSFHVISPIILAAWQPGETITSSCIAEVKMSRSSKFPNGTKVQGMMPWAEYCLLDCSQEFPIGPAEVPVMEGMAGKESMFLGVFGTTGLTGKFLFTIKI